MNQDIIDALIVYLDSFYPDIPIIDVEIQQDLEERPAFFIACINSMVKPRIQDAGFFHTFSYDLYLDAGTEAPERILNEVADFLEPRLLKIPRQDIEGKNYRPENIHSNITDGVLHMLFDVTVAQYEPPENIPDIRQYSLKTTVEVSNG